ncbi:Mobile element protein [hydrothermal vent metagenome]|uniref:Mobile element protein n=1 Tax=hydrothermal vent metagenome TaxID=652676 RepID=A0A3B0ZBU8_9ZZZZ
MGIHEARQWMRGFTQWYNHQHRHSGIKYVTPAQRHAGLDKMILATRHEAYQSAKQKHPERWSGKTRDWNKQDKVILNPDKSHKVIEVKSDVMAA